MLLSIEERVFLVEYIFREGNRYTDLVQEQFAEMMRPGSTPRVMLTHKTHDCGRRRNLMLCMKNPCMTKRLESGLRELDGALLALYSLTKQ
jgi:hypothetical protein